MDRKDPSLLQLGTSDCWALIHGSRTLGCCTGRVHFFNMEHREHHMSHKKYPWARSKEILVTGWPIICISIVGYEPSRSKSYDPPLITTQPGMFNGFAE